MTNDSRRNIIMRELLQLREFSGVGELWYTLLTEHKSSMYFTDAADEMNL